jgi:hypothetical protein
MWLIQFHLAFSILCLMCHMGIKIVFAKGLKRYKNKGRKKNFANYLLYFSPGINVLFLFILVYMAVCNDDTAAKINSGTQEAKE